jgi:hypothetical protein
MFVDAMSHGWNFETLCVGGTSGGGLSAVSLT